MNPFDPVDFFAAHPYGKVLGAEEDGAVTFIFIQILGLRVTHQGTG